MMPASKHLDIVTGIDIHIIQPPGPVPPLPVPHPFIGFLFDSGDYMGKVMEAIAATGVLGPVMKVAQVVKEALPDIPESVTETLGKMKSAANAAGIHGNVPCTVWINGLPRVRAGTPGSNKPVHVPIGGVFVKGVPGNACEAFMGSATVLADKEPFTYASLPVLSCQCVGMPTPPRGGKAGQMGFFLPTSLVLPIPMGPIVLVGGPPTISMNAMAMKAGAVGLSKLKASKFMKSVSAKVHNAADKMMDALKIPAGSFIRNLAHRGICMLTGHPVDVATGKVMTDSVDFEIPGPIPLVWERVWYSTSVYTGPLGHGWHHHYDMAMAVDEINQTLVIRMADGRPVIFPTRQVGEQFFNKQESLTLLRDEKGYALKDKDNLLYRFTEKTYTTGGIYLLDRVENANGFAIAFQYDGQGYLQQILDSAGRLFQVEVDKLGRIRAIHAPHPNEADQTFPIVQYQYDEFGNLATVYDALQHPFRYYYKNHLLVQETNRNGLSFYFKWDGIDDTARCIRTWGDGGIYDHKLTYNTEEKYTIVKNSLGHKSTHYWNDMGLVYKSIDPLGHISSKKYSDDTYVLSETDELGRIIRYAYDEYGNRILTNFPDGSKLLMKYDEHLFTAAIDQIQGKWEWKYNEAGQLTERINPLEHSTKYTYQEGMLYTVTDTAGGITTLAYDQQYNLSSLTTPIEVTNRWEYDLLGRCTVAIDPKENIEKRIFNLNSWVILVNEPDGNVRELIYDNEGNVIWAKDKHHDVRFVHAGMNQLKARIEAGTRVEFKYNTEEDLIGIVNEHGYVYRFDLNANGEVEFESGFDEIKRYYKRDAAGRVNLVLRALGIETRYEYDEMDRVIGVHHSTGEHETYTYRGNGELMKAVNDRITVQFERDPLGQVLKEIQGDFVIKSEYDLLGMRTHLSSSLGADLHINRNVMGDVEKVAADNNGEVWEASFKRDSLGLELERILPGGVHSEWKRDQLGRPIEQKTTVTGGNITRNRRYVWDVNDRLKQIIDPQKGAWNFEHDALGNLSAAQYPDGTFEFRMPDAVGNLFKTKDRKDRKYGRAGQLLNANGTHYKYDAEGNLIKKIEKKGGVWRYEWNASGMLQRVIRPDGMDVTFTYDALGRRISKTYRGKTTRWVWDGNVPLHEWVETNSMSEQKIWQAVKETVEAGEQKSLLATAPANGPPNFLLPKDLITWIFEPESFAPLAKFIEGQQYSIVCDHVGIPNFMVNANGKLIWSVETSIYSNLRYLVGDKQDCPFRSLGQYEDNETELYYNRFRYYDSENGIYITQDPIGLLGSLNLHSYVHDPNAWMDPLGLVELYALVVEKDGKYPVYEWGKKDPVGFVNLKKGSIWKYGETRNPNRRYSQVFLEEMGLRYRTLAKGNKDYVRAWEKYYLTRYQEKRKKLPPGNKCRH